MREMHNFTVSRSDYAQAPDIDATAFKRAFRGFAGGVCVITAGEGERRTGLTATSATSLSVEPPSVLFCVNRGASAAAVVVEEGRFGLNILSADQAAIADRFAGKDGCKGAARYADAEWRSSVTGASLLVGASAALDCVVTDVIERHSHLIVVGRVVDALTFGGGALVYRNGVYSRLDDAAFIDAGRPGFC